MPDDFTNTLRFGDDEVPAGFSNCTLQSADAKPPPARSREGRDQLGYWHRHASVVELLVAFGIIFLALVRIVTAHGDETSLRQAATPIAEMRSLSLRTTDR